MRLAALALLPLPALAFAAGCSDPVPPSPNAAWSVSFIDPGLDCAIKGHNEQVGQVDSHKKPTVVTDGIDGAEVQCTVKGDGTYSVDGRARHKGRALSVKIASISSSATEEAPAAGIVSYSSANTAGDPYVSPPDTPCQFYFVKGSNEGVAKGKVWAAFKCPLVESEGSLCEITQGYVLFENCSDSDIEEEEDE